MVKGMKQTEIGMIPEDWRVYTVLELIDLLTDYDANGSFSTVAENVKSYNYEEYAWYVRSTDLENNSKLSDVKYVDKDSYDFLKKTSLYGGELLFLKRGDIGNVYLFEMRTERATLAPNLYLLKLNKVSSAKYLYQYFISANGQRQLKSKNAGSTLGALYKDDVKSMLVPLPPLPEQDAIAGALSDADAWIESLEQLIAKKRLIKQGAMQELLTHSTSSGQAKEGWEVKKLGEVIEILADYTANGSFESLKNNVRYYSKKNYAVLVRTTDLDKKEFEPERFTDEIGYRFLSKTSLFGGELILANVGSIGKVFKVPKYNMPMTLAPNTYMIKLFSSFSQEYVYQWMKSGEFVTKLLAKVGSSTLMAINKNNLRDIIIPIPNTYSEQTRIATILSDMDAQLEALEAQLHKARQIKQGMMQELLTGRIRLEL